ncbi:MAG: lactate permease, partial [Spirosoma sp.]|nr:lactate permease [Spirosoma sp.]
ANVSGGVVGKMISPQSIAVAAAAGNLVGQESQLFRFTVKHSFYMLTFICFLTLTQAYVLKWLIPTYVMLDGKKPSVLPDLSHGYMYLLILAVLLASLALTLSRIRRNRKPAPDLVK